MFHPKRDLSAIDKVFGIPARRSWKQGDLRRTRTGQELGGAYPGSFWYTRLTNREVSSKRVGLESCLATTIEELRSHRAYISRLRRSGGRAELFIGVTSTKNFGFELPPDLSMAAAKLGLTLSFDVYPYPQNDL